VGEQRYKAVMAVLSGGRTVAEVARDSDVSRQTMHAWLDRYERAGMEGMGDRSHRPIVSRLRPLRLRNSSPSEAVQVDQGSGFNRVRELLSAATFC